MVETLNTVWVSYGPTFSLIGFFLGLAGTVYWILGQSHQNAKSHQETVTYIRENTTALKDLTHNITESLEENRKRDLDVKQMLLEKYEKLFQQVSRAHKKRN